MNISAALTLGGAVVYLANDSAGALMIAFGIVLAIMPWLWKVTDKWLIERRI